MLRAPCSVLRAPCSVLRAALPPLLIRQTRTGTRDGFNADEQQAKKSSFGSPQRTYVAAQIAEIQTEVAPEEMVGETGVVANQVLDGGRCSFVGTHVHKGDAWPGLVHLVLRNAAKIDDILGTRCSPPQHALGQITSFGAVCERNEPMQQGLATTWVAGGKAS